MKIKYQKKETRKNKRRIFELAINDKKWKEEYKEYNKTILLFIIGTCNLRCNYCFNIHNLMGKQEMNLKYIKKIVEDNPEVVKYDIQGGEPMMHGKINEIISYLSSKGKMVGLYTNGYFLSKLKTDHKNLKICISFQSLTAKDKSLRPITDISDNIKKFENVYPIKLVFLLGNHNKKILYDVIAYVENTFKGIDKLTIGAIRNEDDYWNDDFDYVLPLKEYYEIIQKLINEYEGRLSFDIFSKGVLRTKKLPKKQENQICRFKNIFSDKTYVPCLYLIAKDKKISLREKLTLPYYRAMRCKRTGSSNCLADKIYLINRKNDKK